MWNLELRAWSLSLESEIWSLEPGVCGMRLAMGDLAVETQVEVNLTVTDMVFSKSSIKMLMLLRLFEGRLHFHCENRGNSHRGRRDRIHTGTIAPLFSNTIRTPQCKHCLGNVRYKKLCPWQRNCPRQVACSNKTNF